MLYTEKEVNEIQQKFLKELNKERTEKELAQKQIKILEKKSKNYEEVIHDLDSHNYKEKCKNLAKENEELKKKVLELSEKLKISQVSNAKSSDNSCKPPSTDGFKKVVQNNRVKTGRKPGREKGHVKSAPEVSKKPDEIKKVSKVATCSCGCHTEDVEEVKRDLISIKIISHTTQYVGMKTCCPKCHKEYQPHFPDKVKSIINYDEMIKSMIIFLNTYCNVPNEKIVEFFNSITNGQIKICTGTVVNTLKQFDKKSQYSLNTIKNSILEQPVIYEDETPISVNGKINSTIGVFTDKLSYVEAFANRKMESFIEMGILDRYLGTVCHDHNPIHHSFSNSKQAECNFHVLRYCKAEYEKRKSPMIENFMNYLLELRDKVNEYKIQNKQAFSEEEYNEAKEKYLELHSEWQKDFDSHTAKTKYTKYHNDERCLLKRLKEYVDDHLRFITDFRIDFTNNMAERGLRKIKTKLKIAGGFRKLEYAKYYCHAISIIDTCKKQNINIFETLKSLFGGKKKVFNFVY